MRLTRTAVLVVGILFAGALMVAFAASMGPLPSTSKGYATLTADANAMKPGACNWVLNTTPITGSGTITGTTGNDLILGSSGADTINGGGGRDCILGGGGNDTITGNTKVHGKNVIYAGDYCDGGPGSGDTVTMAGNKKHFAPSCDTVVNVP